MASSTKQYLGMEQIGRRLGLDVAVVQRLLEQRVLPGIHLGDTWVVPEADLEAFLRAEFRSQNTKTQIPIDTAVPQPQTRRKERRGQAHAVRLYLRGREKEMPNYASAAISAIEDLAAGDQTFLDRLGAVRRGKRRYVAGNRSDLYSNRPDLPARQMRNGWWIGTNYSRIELEKMLRIACRLSGLEFGSDLVITAAEPTSKAQAERARDFVGIAHSGLGDLAERHDEYLAQALKHART